MLVLVIEHLEFVPQRLIHVEDDDEVEYEDELNQLDLAGHRIKYDIKVTSPLCTSRFGGRQDTGSVQFRVEPLRAGNERPVDGFCNDLE